MLDSHEGNTFTLCKSRGGKGRIAFEKTILGNTSKALLCFWIKSSGVLLLWKKIFVLGVSWPKFLSTENTSSCYKLWTIVTDRLKEIFLWNLILMFTVLECGSRSIVDTIFMSDLWNLFFPVFVPQPYSNKLYWINENMMLAQEKCSRMFKSKRNKLVWTLSKDK